MYVPVDLTNLHEITDHDAALEHALFEEFMISSQSCIDGLKVSLSAATEDNWRTHAHALKGMALNLGAMQLGALGKQAQEAAPANLEAKQQLLADIQQEYGKVEAFLRGAQAA